MPAAPAPISAGVFGIARTTRSRPPAAASIAARGDARGDGQHPLRSRVRDGGRRGGDVARLHREHGVRRGDRSLATVTPGCAAVSCSRRAADTSATASVAGGPARREQAGEQCLAHPPAADDLQRAVLGVHLSCAEA